MKSTRTLMVVLFGSAMMMLGCDKSDQSKQDTAQAQATANKPAENTNTNTNTAPTPAPAPAIADSDLATTADFEEQAEKDITAKNYKGELSSLESEVAKE